MWILTTCHGSWHHSRLLIWIQLWCQPSKTSLDLSTPVDMTVNRFDCMYAALCSYVALWLFLSHICIYFCHVFDLFYLLRLILLHANVTGCGVEWEGGRLQAVLFSDFALLMHSLADVKMDFPRNKGPSLTYLVQQSSVTNGRRLHGCACISGSRAVLRNCFGAGNQSSRIKQFDVLFIALGFSLAAVAHGFWVMTDYVVRKWPTSAR